MKWPNLFVLTKSEQRVVILIVLILLAVAIAQHYRQARLKPFPRRTPAPVESTPVDRVLEEETNRSGD